MQEKERSQAVLCSHCLGAITITVSERIWPHGNGWVAVIKEDIISPNEDET